MHHSHLLFLALLFLIQLCSCEVQKENFIEAEKLQGSSWVLRADRVEKLASAPQFLPRDVLTVDADSIYLRNDLVGARVIDPVNTMKNKSPFRTTYPLSDSSTYFKFRQPDAQTLYVERWANDTALDTAVFDFFQDTLNITAQIEQLIGRTYRYSTDSLDRFIHTEWRSIEPGIVPKKGSPYLIIYSISDPLFKTTSIKKDGPSFFDRIYKDYLITNGTRPVITYYEMRPRFKVFRYRLESITPEEVVMAQLEETDNEFRLIYTKAEREVFDRNENWTKAEIQLLLNEGRITVDDDIDFQTNTEIEYSDESSFITHGLEIKDLNYLDFTFSNDGFYNCFVRDHEIASGRYRITDDLRYLLLGDGNTYDKSIFLLLPDNKTIQFEYPVKMRTPDPLGEVMTSWFWLDLWITLEAPK